MELPNVPATQLGAFAGATVSVIIPAYADSERLRRAMWSVRTSADLPFELIVACAPQSVARNRNAGSRRKQRTTPSTESR